MEQSITLNASKFNKTKLLSVNQLFVAIFIISLAITLTANSKLHSQTLKYSRVILVSSEQTVPAGFIWKIESCLGPRTYTGGGSATDTAPNEHLILINGTSISVATNGYGSVATSGGSAGYYR